MGFYGNIANAAKANFQFDKIYPSRYDMTINAADDDIFVGRYVLVEYDQTVSNEQYDKGWFLRIIPKSDEEIEQRLFTTYEDENIYYYSNSFIEDNIISNLQGTYENGQLIYFQPEHVITHVNLDTQFIKIYANHEYEIVSETIIKNYLDIDLEDWEAYLTYVQKELNKIVEEQEESPMDDSEEENDEPNPEEDDQDEQDEGQEEEIDFSLFLPIAHIANDAAYIEGDYFGEEAVETDFTYAIVPIGYNYLFNKEGEFWTLSDIDDEHEFPTLELKGNEDTDNYTVNFNIDKENFHSERGYDSTVWEKTFVNGAQKYVKIADLNTYIPSIGIESDPPTLIPTRPHWGMDSTNAYYQLHITTPWGLRMKAASNILTLPSISPQGQMYGTESNPELQGMYGRMMARDITLDNTYYPSDVNTIWKNYFQDYTKKGSNKYLLYYDPKEQKWSNDSASEVPAAIYFNKDGFNPKYICYSEDLINPERDMEDSRYRYDAAIARSNWKNEDNITITPTGTSGHVYRRHDGTYMMHGGNDTQEISIMLPSIGDTIAKMWDIIYGGRDFDFIKQTNTRSMEIEWQDAKHDVRRSGLRLRGIYGNSYDTKAMETLAGCINTTHDLLGMIIVSQTAEEMSEHLTDYSMNRIYYNSGTQEYYRKHKTYIYTPISGSNPGLWDPVIDPNDPDKPNQIVDFPLGQYIWYRDYIGGNAAAAQETGKDPILMSDYIIDEDYHPDRDYYYVEYEPITLAPEYRAGRYWFQDGRNLSLDMNDEQTENCRYYTMDATKLVNLKDVTFGEDEEDENNENNENTLTNYAHIYVPGKYYYRDSEGNYKVDVSPYGTFNDEQIDWEYYYTVHVVEEFDQDEEDRIIYVTVVTFERAIVPESEYEPGIYYIVGDPEAEPDEEWEYDSIAENYKRLSNEAYDGNQAYYTKKVTYIKMPANNMVNIEPDPESETPRTNFFVYQTDTFFIPVVDEETFQTVEYKMLTREDFTNTEGIDQMDIYVFGMKDNWEQEHPNNPFRTIRDSLSQDYTEILQLQDTFYMSNRYHQILPDGSIVLDTYKDMTPTARYCVITNATQYDMTGKVVYEPGIYYKPDATSEEGYVLAEDELCPTQNLYKKMELYVYNDTLHQIPRGTKWNINADTIPNSLTLATRKDAWEMIPLEAYATSTNTINGMILKMQQMLEPGDKLTREDDSIAGVMNQVKDILLRFDTMKSNRLLVVDSYGRVQSAELDANSTVEVTVNGTPTNPTISIQTKNLDYREDISTGNANPQTLQWLYSKVAELERRIAELELANTPEEPEPQSEPESEPEEP